MYEISEVMRSHEYKEKMLLVILRDSNVKLVSPLEEIPTTIAANIFF